MVCAELIPRVSRRLQRRFTDNPSATFGATENADFY